jgi:hypothetical protein
MKHLKRFNELFESYNKEDDDLLSKLDLDNDEVWKSFDLDNYEMPKEVEEPKEVEYTWDTCDGCKYFDYESLEKHLGFVHPIYSIIEKWKAYELVYMTPKQYLYKIAHGFGVSYQDAMGGAYKEEKAKLYAEYMEKGDKFPIGHYTDDNPDQEGRHRAMACMMLDVNTIPVVRITKLGYSDVQKYAKKYKDYSREQLDDVYKDVVPDGISDLDWRTFKNYVENRLQ